MKRLTNSQYFSVCTWLKTNEKKLAEEKPTFAQTAQMIQKDLGFEVGDSVITKAKTDSQVFWVSSSPKSPIAYCESHIQKLNAEMATVQKELAAIKSALGM